jgi:hypothetical protein
VPIKPEVLYNDTDAIYLPPMYVGKVLLVASLFSGIQVLRSKDGWKTAEYQGTIPIPIGKLYEGGNVVASVQMGSSSVFMVIGFIFDPWIPGMVAGNRRTQFPFPDITEELEALLNYRGAGGVVELQRSWRRCWGSRRSIEDTTWMRLIPSECIKSWVWEEKDGSFTHSRAALSSCAFNVEEDFLSVSNQRLEPDLTACRRMRCSLFFGREGGQLPRFEAAVTKVSMPREWTKKT